MLFRIVALTLVVLTLAPVTTWACDPGYCVTSTVPANQEAGVPVDSRIFVFFNSTPGFTEPQSGLLLVEADTQQGILGSAQVFNGHNPDAEVGNYVAVLEPLFPLAPNTEYELGFGDGSVCGAPSLKFTTGEQNAVPPIFGGATSVTTTCIKPPAEPTSCDDNDVFPRVRFTFDNPVPEHAAGILVYRAGGNEPIALVPTPTARAELLPATLNGVEDCFVVRAIGLSGIEVGDAEVCTSTAEICADEPTEDMGNPHSDMGLPVDDVGTPELDMGIVDMADDLVTPSTNNGLGEAESGCGCGTSQGPAGSFLLLVFGFLWARRR